jgi:hypothetical protein
MADQPGPIEGALPANIRFLALEDMSDKGQLASQVVKFAKIIDESNELIEALESRVTALEARANAIEFKG